MANPMKLMKLQRAWKLFCENHPKFPRFLRAVRHKGLQEGTIIAITVTTPDGESLSSNLKLTAADLELIEELTAHHNGK